MAESTVTIINPKGIHARPSSLIAKTASRFTSAITLHRDGERANAKSVMEILMLCVPCGTKLVIRASGDDAEEAVRAISDVINVLFEDD